MASRARVELVRSSRPASHAPCAYAAVAHDVSRLVFTAGACPLDDSGAIVAVGDVASQTERVMTNLRAALHAAGAVLGYRDQLVEVEQSPHSAERRRLRHVRP